MRHSVFRSLWRNPLALAGGVVAIVAVLVALAAPWIAPHDPLRQRIILRLKPPAWMPGGEPGFILGTDQLGRDILSRIVYGSRVAVIVGAATVGFSGLLGLIIGMVSGYFGGLVDVLLMRILDIQLSIPFILLALAIIGILGPSLPNIVAVLAVTGWMVYARVVRAEVLSLRTREFIAAVEALGGSHVRILVRHLLPNVISSMVVLATLEVARMMIIESALSFLGLGVQPPTPSWGSMLAEGRVYLNTAWWLATFPGLAVLVTVLGINLFGDWLRDMLDPELEV